MNWTAYLNRCAAFKPFRPHPPAAAPAPSSSLGAGDSIRPPSPDAALAEILGDDYLAAVAHSTDEPARERYRPPDDIQ